MVTPSTRLSAEPSPARAPVSSPRRAEAFALLNEVVSRLHERHGRAFAATLKLELLAASGNSFDEEALGYSNFAAFLEDAKDHGVVALAGTGTTANDLQAFPIPESARPGGPRSARRLRPDLWAAFTDWQPGRLRLYDPSVDKAFVFSAHDALPPELETIREAFKRDPSQFVAVQHITRERTEDWMREFADAATEPARSELLESLTDEQAVAAFYQTARRHPVAERGWRCYRVEKVAEAVVIWAREHGLNIDVFGDAAARGRLNKAPGNSSPTDGPRARLVVPESQLRAMLADALEALSVNELLNLPIPLHALLTVTPS
jgi:hypothetical protein